MSLHISQQLKELSKSAESEGNLQHLMEVRGLTLSVILRHITAHTHTDAYIHIQTFIISSHILTN